MEADATQKQEELVRKEEKAAKKRDAECADAEAELKLKTDELRTAIRAQNRSLSELTDGNEDT